MPGPGVGRKKRRNVSAGIVVSSTETHNSTPCLAENYVLQLGMSFQMQLFKAHTLICNALKKKKVLRSGMKISLYVYILT